MSADPSQTPKKRRLLKTMASYQALVDAFRQAPGNFSEAARLTGFHRSAAKFVWEKGWSKLGLAGAGPIRDVLANDVAKAKADAAERARKERDLADAEAAKRRQEAVAALQAEADLMSANRRGLLSLSGTVEKMIGILPLYALRIQEAVAQPDPNDPRKLVPIPNPQVSVDQALKVVQGVALAANRLAYASSTLIELARLERGQATVVVGSADEMAEPSEVLEELRAAATLFDRLEAGRGTGGSDPGPTLQ